MLRWPWEQLRIARVRVHPRRWVYAGLGVVLAVGAPAGLVAVEGVKAGQMSLSWLRIELAGNLHEYVYVLASTTAVFSLFGYFLGRQADRLADLAITDPLTGLSNARLLRARLDDEFARSRRYGDPLSLLLLDLDGLKDINDRGGHRAGDSALRTVAAALRDGSRAADIVARWGGDEFALLAPHTEEGAAALLGERIRSGVCADAGNAVTVSAGVATDDTGARFGSPDGLIGAADAALYEAKRRGKNRVVTWGDTNARDA